MVISRDSRMALGAVLAVVTLAAALALATLLGGETPQQTTIPAQVPRPNDPPLAGAEKMSLVAATRALPVPIYRPNVVGFATDDTIRDVWVNSSNDPELNLDYESGLSLKVRPAGTSPSNDTWASELARDGIKGSIEVVSGSDVFFVAQSDTSLPSARFFINGALVTLIGHGDFTIDQMRELAKSTITRAHIALSEKAAASQ